MGKNKSTAAQIDLFSFTPVSSIQKISVHYIEHKEYIFVRAVKPEKPQGAKALKNEDFIDHDYLSEIYAYSQQVTTRLINDRYKIWQAELAKKSIKDKKILQQKIDNEIALYGYSPTLENAQQQSRTHNYYISYEMPERLDKYKSRVTYRNYEPTEMFVELSFYGPLSRPRIANNANETFIALNCVIPRQHQIIIDTYNQEAIGNSLLQYFEGSTFWSLSPGDNELELSAQDNIGEGSVRVSTRYELKT